VSGCISFAIVAIGIFGLFQLTRKSDAPAAEPKVAAPPLVETVPLTPHDGSWDISVDGSVIPFREISTSAEVSGRVVFKAPECKAGKYVTAGTLLLRIDPQDYDFEIQRLRSQLNEATATKEELEVEILSTATLIKLSREDLALQQRELARMTSLAGNNVVTESDLDRAKQAELAARNALAVLANQEHLQKTRRNRVEAGRKLVESQLEKAELDKSRTDVFAATDGVVVQDLVEEGDYIQKGEPLVTLEDTSAVEVKCSLRMDELYWLWRGQSHSEDTSSRVAHPYEIPPSKVKVIFEMAQGTVRYEWPGRLSRFDGIGLDETTRTVPCRVIVDDPLDVSTTTSDGSPVIGPPALVRGMYVDVKIQVPTVDGLVRIPERAIQPGKSLWVARDGKLRLIKPLRLVELVREESVPPYWIVDATASKLMPEDAIIVSSLASVTDGMPIQRKDAP